jgi:hypothetical protein
MRFIACLFAAALFAFAADSDRDFSGKWILDPDASNVRALPAPAEPILTVTQDTARIRCSVEGAEWVFLLSGGDSDYRAGAEKRNSAVKWEGAALLVNTIVSGPQDYSVMDRWRLSADRDILTITRQVVRRNGESEGRLVYRREGAVQASGPAAAPAAPALSPRPALEPPPEITVRSGTRILLSLLNSLSTKHSREGDRIYLQTAFPVTVDGRIVIPRGSSVTGTVTRAKQPGRVAGKGELYIRFDSLTLPNGVTRDFRSRLSSADGTTHGEVDRNEGKVTSEGNKSGDARTVATGAGAGASIGSIAGAASGHTGMGAGVGAAAGAAAGLAGVLFGRGPDAVLPRGTSVEMVLDRDLQYRPDELSR